MSYKKVNELRKAGNLEQALKMAQADLERGRDKWSCAAMFWVLRDMCRKMVEQGQQGEANALADRMEALLPEMDDDQVARKALNGVRYGSVPFLKEMLHARDLSRDNATVDEALRQTADVMSHLDDNGHLVIGHTRQAMAGWVIQEWLKQRVDTAPASMVKRALALYLKLDRVDRPGALHSQILYWALRLKRQHPAEFRFATFFDLWGGMTTFTDEDWKPGEATAEGHKAPLALAQRAANAALSERRGQDKRQPLGSDGEAMLVELIHRFPGDVNYKRLLAIEYAHTGRRDKALAVYRRILPLLWRKFYVWTDLAALLDDERLRVGALCKAISLQRAEQFLTRARLDLARLLLNRGDHAAAARELALYEHGRQAAEQQPSRAFFRLKQRLDATVTPATSNKALYAAAISDIEQHFAPLLQSERGVVTRRTNKRGEPYAIVGECYLNERMIKAIDNGTEVIVRFATDDNGKRVPIKVEKI